MNNLFNSISVNDQKKILKLLETSTLKYKKNSEILSTIKDNIIGIVLDGSAELIKIDYDGNRTILEELNVNSIFGTVISSLTNDEYKIISKTDTKILIIDFEIILSNNNINYPYYNKFIKNLLKITTNVIQERNNKIEILTKKTIRDKLLTYFNIYSRTHGTKNIYLPFSYTDLADYIAVDRSAMSREMKNLINDKIIDKKGKIITLLYK